MIRRRRARRAWLPVTLRWRKPLRRRERMLVLVRQVTTVPGANVPRVSQMSRLSWRAHVHLHFAASPIRRRCSSRHTATTIRQHATRTAVERRHTHSDRSLHERHDARSSAFRRREVLRSSRHSLRERHHSVTSASYERLRSSSSSSSSSDRLRELRLFRTIHNIRSRAGHDVTTLHTSNSAVERRAAFAPPAQIVWRREREQYETTRESQRVDHAIGRSQTVHEVRSEFFATQGAARPVPQTGNNLDPALLDRLTSDVIRRVEQRARIERERRGL